MMLRSDKAVAFSELDFDAEPIQGGLGKNPYYVALATMVMDSDRPSVRSALRRSLEELLWRWPTALAFAMADGVAVESVLRPYVPRAKARQLQRFATQWLGTMALKDLTGVNKAVLDAIEEYC